MWNFEFLNRVQFWYYFYKNNFNFNSKKVSAFLVFLNRFESFQVLRPGSNWRIRSLKLMKTKKSEKRFYSNFGLGLVFQRSKKYFEKFKVLFKISNIQKLKKFSRRPQSGWRFINRLEVVRTRGQVRMDRIFGPRFLEFSKILVPRDPLQKAGKYSIENQKII